MAQKMAALDPCSLDELERYSADDGLAVEKDFFPFVSALEMDCGV